MKKVSVYTNHYQPENFKLNDIVDHLEKHYLIDVTTQIPNYPKGKFYEGFSWFKRTKEKINNVSITRLKVIPRGSNKIMLMLNYISYIISSLLYSVFKKRQNTDFVFIYVTSPIFISWSAIRHANKQNVPKIMYLLDLWPDNLISMLNIKNKKVIRRLEKICSSIYNNMDQILISSDSFKEVLISYGVENEKITYFPQHIKMKDMIQKHYNWSETRILFAGNIGEAQGLEILLEVAIELKIRNNELIHFNIVGDGRYKEEMIKETKRKNIEKWFTFYDSVPEEKLKEHYIMNDFGLIILRDDEALNKHLPLKVQSYMANSMAILGIVHGEAKKVIQTSKSGICITATSVEGITDEIELTAKIPKEKKDEYSENAYNYALENFEFKKQMEELRRIFS